MLKMILSVAVLTLVVTSQYKVSALECYVCRGCAEVTEEHLQECNPSEVTTQEPVTLLDGEYEGDIFEESQGLKAPFLEEQETEQDVDSKFVLDTSDLGGSRGRFSRSLQQYRNGEDDARCVLAVYNHENGTPDVVRGCSTASDVNEERCREAVGDGYNGTFVYCRLCADDLCNSATKSAIAVVVVVIGLLFTM